MDQPTRWPAVLLATLCGVAAAMNIGKLPVALPMLRQQFGLSLVEAGWVVSAFNTLAVLGAMFIGSACAWFGPLRFCLLGLLLSCAGNILGLASWSLAPLLASRVLEGAGFIVIGVSAPALVTVATVVRERRFALSVWSSFMPAGAGIVTLLAPPLLATAGWQGVWWLVLGLLAVAALLLYRMREAYGMAPHSAGGAGGGLRQTLGRPAPWLLALAFTAYTIQFFAVITWLPTFLREQRGMSILAISLLTALTLGVNVLGNLLGGWLMQRHVRRGQLIATANFVMGACAVGIFSEALPDLVRYGLCLTLTFAGGVIPASILSSSSTLAESPRQISTLQGLYMQFSNLGQFVGPPLIAILVSASGYWRSALAVTGGAAACGVILGWRLRSL